MSLTRQEVGTGFKGSGCGHERSHCIHNNHRACGIANDSTSRKGTTSPFLSRSHLGAMSGSLSLSQRSSEKGRQDTQLWGQICMTTRQRRPRRHNQIVKSSIEGLIALPVTDAWSVWAIVACCGAIAQVRWLYNLMIKFERRLWISVK